MMFVSTNRVLQSCKKQLQHRRTVITIKETVTTSSESERQRQMTARKSGRQVTEKKNVMCRWEVYHRHCIIIIKKYLKRLRETHSKSLWWSTRSKDGEETRTRDIREVYKGSWENDEQLKHPDCDVWLPIFFTKSGCRENLSIGNDEKSQLQRERKWKGEGALEVVGACFPSLFDVKPVKCTRDFTTIQHLYKYMREIQMCVIEEK